jgi:uncharacterized protein YutE (UPF0331/DUF86 family)
MTEVHSREARVLDALQQRYEARGFSFFKYPSRDLIPEFLGDYTPDAIALGPNGNIVIEVKSSPRAAAGLPAAQIAERFRNQSGWKFELVLADEVKQEDVRVAPPSKELILEVLAEIRELAGTGHRRAALVLAWGALEAAARICQPGLEDKPKIPTSLVELLEREGLVSHSAARRLRSLINVRNGIAHGDFSRRVDQKGVLFLVECVEELLSEQ